MANRHTHPRASRPDADEAIAGVDLAEGAVATSGDYERYFDIGEERYCHLLDARAGHPVRHWQSISVVAPICVVAGSCATIAMLLENDALPFLDAQRVRYLAIARDGTAHGSVAASDAATGRPYPAARTRPA